MYDFPRDASGKATPYGLYDQVANHAYVVVGMSAVTAAFAVACIRRWWATYGRERYPDAHHLMIECDGGGCNGHRPRLWKHELQQLADPPRAFFLRQVIERREEFKVFAPGEKAIDRPLLRHVADQMPDNIRVLHRIMP